MSTLQRISITTIAALMLGTVGASATELPQYEVAGFPISTVQVSILGSSGVQEQSPTPTLTLDGMPASPHQIAVLRARTKQQIADRSNKDASGERTQTTN